MKLFTKLALASTIAFAGWAQALTIAPYGAEAFAKAQGAGEAVALHFHASWCPTCRAQAQVLEMLKDEPDLDITVLVADYDKEGQLKKAHKVRTQSVLISFRGKAEKARQTGGTSPEDIRAILRAAL
jgi:thiol-disulfide isomerase/thioredoxin